MRIQFSEGARPSRDMWAARAIWFSSFTTMAEALVASEPFERLIGDTKAHVVAALGGAEFRPHQWDVPSHGYPCLPLTDIVNRQESFLMTDQLSGEAFEVCVQFTLVQSGVTCGLQLEVDVWSPAHAGHVAKAVVFSSVWENPHPSTLTTTYLVAQGVLRGARLPPKGAFDALAGAVAATLAL